MDPHAPQPYGAPPGGAQPGSGPPDYALERRATKPEDAREIAKNVVVISKAPQRRSRFDQVSPGNVHLSKSISLLKSDLQVC